MTHSRRTRSIRLILASILVAALAACSLGGTSYAASGHHVKHLKPSISGLNSETDGTGGSNIVQVINHDDNRLRIDGQIQLNHIEGPNASPVNKAIAYSSCTNCQTFAVALQINLISTSATSVQPQNKGIAVNYKCTNCTTVADAYQYNISVSDPKKVSHDEKDLIDQIHEELDQLKSQEDLTATEAEAQINDIIAQFTSLASKLKTSHQEQTQDTTPGAKSKP